MNSAPEPSVAGRPALGGALWPVTFVVLQVLTDVYFARSGFWRILLNGDVADASAGRP